MLFIMYVVGLLLAHCLCAQCQFSGTFTDEFHSGARQLSGKQRHVYPLNNITDNGLSRSPWHTVQNPNLVGSYIDPSITQIGPEKALLLWHVVLSPQAGLIEAQYMDTYGDSVSPVIQFVLTQWAGSAPAVALVPTTNCIVLFFVDVLQNTTYVWPRKVIKWQTFNATSASRISAVVTLQPSLDNFWTTDPMDVSAGFLQNRSVIISWWQDFALHIVQVDTDAMSVSLTRLFAVSDSPIVRSLRQLILSENIVHLQWTANTSYDDAGDVAYNLSIGASYYISSTAITLTSELALSPTAVAVVPSLALLPSRGAFVVTWLENSSSCAYCVWFNAYNVNSGIFLAPRVMVSSAPSTGIYHKFNAPSVTFLYGDVLAFSWAAIGTFQCDIVTRMYRYTQPLQEMTVVASFSGECPSDVSVFTMIYPSTLFALVVSDIDMKYAVFANTITFGPTVVVPPTPPSVNITFHLSGSFDNAMWHLLTQVLREHLIGPVVLVSSETRPNGSVVLVYVPFLPSNNISLFVEQICILYQWVSTADPSVAGLRITSFSLMQNEEQLSFMDNCTKLYPVQYLPIARQPFLDIGFYASAVAVALACTCVVAMIGTALCFMYHHYKRTKKNTFDSVFVPTELSPL